MNTFWFEENLNWIERAPLRKPVQVAPSAKHGLNEWWEETHQEQNDTEVVAAILTIEPLMGTII